MTAYKHLFFDLDRTLWDFDRNSLECVNELFVNYKLETELGIDFTVFYRTFKEINAISWRDFRKGEQSKEDLRLNRFVQTFFKYGSGDWKKARKLSREYIEICPKKVHLIEGAEDLLESIKGKVEIHIITNGFSDTQRVKIKSSGLDKYINQLIISDETSFAKPDTGIFNLALKKSGASKSDSLMIGDDYRKDIVGAKNAGINQAHFNPEHTTFKGEKPTYTLAELSELKSILRI